MAEEIINMDELEQTEQAKEPTEDKKPAPPKAHKLYDNLISDGYTSANLGSKEEFTNAMSDSKKAAGFYSKLIKEGYTANNIGSQQEFITSFQKKNEVQPSATGGQKQKTIGQPGTSPTQSPSQLPSTKVKWEENPLNPLATVKKAQADKEAADKIMPRPTPTVDKTAPVNVGNIKKYEAAQQLYNLADKHKANVLSQDEHSIFSPIPLIEDIGGALIPGYAENKKKQKDAQILSANQQLETTRKNAMASQEAIKQDIPKILSPVSEKWNDFISYTIDNIPKIDEYKIRDFANKTAKQYGVEENGMFYNLIKREASNLVTQKLIQPEVDKQLRVNYKKTYGRDLDADLQSENNQAAIKLEQIKQSTKSSANKLQNQISTEARDKVSTLQSDITSQVNALNNDIKTASENINNKYSSLIKDGKFIGSQEQYSQYQQDFSALQQKEKENKEVFATLNKKFLDEQNLIFSKANARYRREAEELSKIAQSEYEKFKPKANPQLQKNIEKIYNKSYDEVLNKHEELRRTMSLANTPTQNLTYNLISSLGNYLKGQGESMGLEGVVTFGEYLQNTFAQDITEFKSAKDYLDFQKLAKFSGQTIGSMLPGMVGAVAVTAATGGEAAPVGWQMISAGLTQWAAETYSSAGNIKADVLAATGDIGKANNAERQTIAFQKDILPLYAFSGLPYVGKAVSGLIGKVAPSAIRATSPTIAKLAGFAEKKWVAPLIAGAAETGEEFIQEYSQNLSEEAIRKEGSYANMFDYHTKEKLQNTALNIAPMFLFGSVGELAGESKEAKQQYALQQAAKSFALKTEFAKLAPGQKEQFLFDIMQRQGAPFTAAYITANYSSGLIDKATFEDLQQTYAKQVDLLGKTQELGLTPVQAKLYNAFSTYHENEKKRFDETEDPILKTIAAARMVEYQNALTNIAMQKEPNYSVVTFPDNTQMVFMHPELENALNQPAFAKAVANGDIKVGVFGESEKLNTKLEETKKNVIAAQEEEQKIAKEEEANTRKEIEEKFNVEINDNIEGMGVEVKGLGTEEQTQQAKQALREAGIKLREDDTENVTGIPGQVGEGQELVTTEPQQGRSAQETGAGGVFQTQGVGEQVQGTGQKVLAPISVSNKTELADLEQRTQSDKNKSAILESAKKAIATLKSVFPDMDIFIHEDADAYNQTMTQLQGEQNSRGNFVFGRDENDKPTGWGRIDINLSNASETTVAHEVTHAVLLKAFGDSPATFKQFRDRISPILRADLNKELLEFEKMYAGKEVAPEEYLTQLSALLSKGAETVEYKPSTLRKIAAVINDFVAKITGGRFQPFKGEVDFKNFVDFLNQMAGAIREGGKIDLETKESGDAIINGVVSLDKIKNKSDLGYKKHDVKWVVSEDSGIKLNVPEDKKSMYDVVEKSGGAVVVINSDATGIGLTKDKDLLQGGIGYTFIDANVLENIGFAASNDGKISSFYEAIMDAAKKRDDEFPEMKGKPVAVFVMVQTPAAMFGNTYAAEYFGRVLNKITTSKLFDTKEAKKELIEFIEDYKANNKTGKKYENSLDKLISLIKTTDFSKKESIKKLTDLLITNRASKEDKSAKFGFDIRRSFFEKFFVGVGTVKEGAPARNLRLKLKEKGYNHQDFFEEFGDNNVMSLLEGDTPGKKLADGNFTLTGFYVDPYQNKENYIQNSKKGTYQHKQFNSKFYGTDPYVLDGKYYVDKMFPEARFTSQKTGEEVPVQVAAAGSLYPRTQKSANQIIERAKELKSKAQLPQQKGVNVGEVVSKSKINPIDSEKGIDNKDFQDYDGMFSKNNASSPYLTDLLNDEVNGKRGYQLFYKRRMASIEMMSPEEYLKRVRQGQGDTIEGQKRMIFQEQKDRIKAGIEKGDKIDMPSLSYDKKGDFDTQEGRHRATIAKERGEKLIPVVIERVAKEQDLMNKASEIINEANKDLKTNDIDEIIDYATDKFNLHRDAVAYLKDNASELKAELPQQKGEGVSVGEVNDIDKILEVETPILLTPKTLSTKGLPNLDIVPSKEVADALESEIGGDKGVVNKDIRTIPIQEYDVTENNRSRQIAEQIQDNGWIEPLIVSYDKNNDVYIVEGQHRAAALKELGYDKAPVVVIYDKTKLGVSELPQQKGEGVGEMDTKKALEKYPELKTTKIVDDEGNPLIVRHQSQSDIDITNMSDRKKGGIRDVLGRESKDRYGMYFTTEGAESLKEMFDKTGKGKTYEVYLDVKNPLILEGTHYFDFETNKPVPLSEDVVKNPNRYLDVKDMSKNDIERLKALGYDGVWGNKNEGNYKGIDEIVVFDKSKIKPTLPQQKGEGIGEVKTEEGNIKSKAQKVHDETGFISVPSMIEIVKDNDPTYLGGVMEHIQDMGEKLRSGNVNSKDVAKSYLMAVSSIRSGDIGIEKFENSVGKKVDEVFLEPNNKIRTEGAMAFLLTTDEGKRFLNNIESGKIDEKDRKFISSSMKPFGMFGENESKYENIFGKPSDKQINLTNINEFNSLLKGGVKNESELFDAIVKLKGISQAKVGFVSNFLGVGTRGVIDAREIQGWLRGSVFQGERTAQEAEMEKQLTKSNKSLSPLQQEILNRMRAVGEAFNIDPLLAEYIGHHMIWDAVAKEKTTHDGLYLAMTQNEADFNNKLNNIKSKAQKAKVDFGEGEDAKNNKKEFDKLTSTIPNSGDVTKYLSGETIEKYEGEKPRNEQEVVAQQLRPALERGVDIINKAKELFGDKYVENLLQYVETENLPPANKALIYVSLENEIAKQKIENPSEAAKIEKMQDLVRAKSQAFLRSNSLAINMGRLRKFAEVGYDVNKLTDRFFSSRELEDKKKIETALQATADDINKEAERIIAEEESIKAKIDEGVKKEIDKIYENLSAERKKVVNKRLSILDKIKQGLLNKFTFKSKPQLAEESIKSKSDINNIIEEGYNKIFNAMKADVDIKDAINIGIDHIKENIEKTTGQKWADEKEFRNYIMEEFKNQGLIKTKSKEKTTSDRLEDAKKRIKKQIESLKEQIANKERVKKKDKLVPDAELENLKKQRDALVNILDKYVPKESDLLEERKLKAAKSKLENEIIELNRQIQKGQKDKFEKKESKENAELDKLRAEKEARQAILEALDPTPKMFIENALIEQGFGRQINVKTKNGVEKRWVLDWKKLAGEEGSVDNIRERVESALRDKGYFGVQLLRIQDAFVEEYNNLSQSIAEKALNEINARNNQATTPEQKSAVRKLVEMYNYGLFDKDPNAYETALAKTLGLSGLSLENFERVRELGEVLSNLFNNNFEGQPLNESQLRTAIQVIEEKMRIILNSEAMQQGGTAFKLSEIVKGYMDASQRMMLNTVKQGIENPISGLLERFYSSLGYAGTIPEQLNAQQRKLARDIYKEMVLQKGLGYGNVGNAFISKGSLDAHIHNMSDNELVQGIMSLAMGKTILDAVDSSYKAKITQQKFTYNLIKILTKDRMVNGNLEKGMSKEEAKRYVAEKISGQSFEDAKQTARDIIDKINTQAGEKIFNDSPEFINRLATDIVNAALVNGEKITEEMVTAAYNAAYKAAGRGLGHVANNPISEQINTISGKLESRITDAIKEKKYAKATYLNLYSIFYRNVANPFVGGGTNWIVLKAEKTGLGLISGLVSMYKDKTKIDLMTDAGMKELEDAMYNSMKTRDKFIRGAVGGAITALAFMLIKATGADDDYEKWIKKNQWAKKYISILTPEIMLAMLAARSKGAYTKYLESSFNKNEAFDKGKMAIKAASYLATGKKEKAAGQAGELVGASVGTPIPWRLVRDGQQIWVGARGGEPYAVNPTPSNTFMEGYLKGGMIDYLGYAPTSEDKSSIVNETELESPEYKTYKEKGVKIPAIGNKNQIRANNRPDGVMSDEEYAKYSELVKKYMKEGWRYYNEDGDRIKVESLSEILETKFERAEYKKPGREPSIHRVKGEDLTTEELQSKVNSLKQKASDKAKEELGLVKESRTTIRKPE